MFTSRTVSYREIPVNSVGSIAGYLDFVGSISLEIRVGPWELERRRHPQTSRGGFFPIYGTINSQDCIPHWSPWIALLPSDPTPTPKPASQDSISLPAPPAASAPSPPTPRLLPNPGVDFGNVRADGALGMRKGAPGPGGLRTQVARSCAAGQRLPRQRQLGGCSHHLGPPGALASL